MRSRFNSRPNMERLRGIVDRVVGHETSDHWLVWGHIPLVYVWKDNHPSFHPFGGCCPDTT